jgi:hypothetical protein
MANQFVQENNQIMLWKIVNNTSQLVDFFAPMKPGFKEEWFKGIIHQVYGETQGRNVSLRDINKRALDCMLESIRKISAEKRPLAQAPTTFTQGSTTFTQGSTTFTQGPSLTPSVQTSASFRDSRESQMMEQYNRRQVEYESMTKKTVPTPTFNDSIKDEAIQDITKALNEYKNIRDADIMPSSMPSSNIQDPPIRIQISDPVDISLDAQEPNSHRKQVQWGENTEHLFDKTQSIYESTLMKKIQTLEDKINNISSKMDSMLEVISRK